jgi:hypothetical protein
MSSKPPQRLTKRIETAITEDWRQHLTGLAVYQPRRLLRRVGPLLVGVCLDRDSLGDKYKPCFHVHFPVKEFPTVSLTLGTPLRSLARGPDYVEVRFHQQKFWDAVSRLIEQSPLALWGPVQLDQVIAAYRQHLATLLGQRQVASLYGDCILLLASCVRESAAGELLSEVLGNSADQRAFQTYGGREAYERTMRDAIAHPDRIERTVSAQINALAVDHLPTDEFIV